MDEARSKYQRTLSVECEDGLDGDIHATEVVALEHDFGHSFSVLEGIHWWFCEENLAPRGIYSQLLCEGIVPQVFHVIPSPDNAVLHLRRQP